MKWGGAKRAGHTRWAQAFFGFIFLFAYFLCQGTHRPTPSPAEHHSNPPLPLKHIKYAQGGMFYMFDVSPSIPSDPSTPPCTHLCSVPFQHPHSPWTCTTCPDRHAVHVQRISTKPPHAPRTCITCPDRYAVCVWHVSIPTPTHKMCLPASFECLWLSLAGAKNLKK